ncbi:MAG: hypothetical protein WCA20_35520 [Candidatus Sulfotelmatobacter sp.]
MLTINKNAAITKLNRLIEDGRQNAGQVIEHVMTHQPQDYVVKANALQFSGNGALSVALNNAEFGLHPNGARPQSEPVPPSRLAVRNQMGRVSLAGSHRVGEVPTHIAQRE